jgi:hypothetical protein
VHEDVRELRYPARGTLRAKAAQDDDLGRARQAANKRGSSCGQLLKESEAGRNDEMRRGKSMSCAVVEDAK